MAGLKKFYPNAEKKILKLDKPITFEYINATKDKVHRIIYELTHRVSINVKIFDDDMCDNVFVSSNDENEFCLYNKYHIIVGADILHKRGCILQY
ncbi:MAG: hypothetical protein [Cotesia congregata filamentous virus 2]